MSTENNNGSASPADNTPIQNTDTAGELTAATAGELPSGSVSDDIAGEHVGTSVDEASAATVSDVPLQSAAERADSADDAAQVPAGGGQPSGGVSDDTSGDRADSLAGEVPAATESGVHLQPAAECVDSADTMQVPAVDGQSSDGLSDGIAGGQAGTSAGEVPAATMSDVPSEPAAERADSDSADAAQVPAVGGQSSGGMSDDIADDHVGTSAGEMPAATMSDVPSEPAAERVDSTGAVQVPAGGQPSSGCIGSGTHTLRAASLYKRFGHKSVVQGIDFKMHTGEVLGLLGPNGAGKTTTFYMIVGFYQPTAGEIFLDEQRITACPMYRRARQGISYLPQEPSVFKKLTVEENIWAILETRKDLTRAQKLERLEELIEEFAIGRIRKQMAFTLSGGERRRTEIARSLAIEPKFLLLDEPFAGIDPIAVADIKNMIGLLSKRGIGILITDHNVRDTLEITTRAIIISSGQIMIQGSKQEILDSPLAREVYLGKDFSM